MATFFVMYDPHDRPIRYIEDKRIKSALLVCDEPTTSEQMKDIARRLADLLLENA